MFGALRERGELSEMRDKVPFSTLIERTCIGGRRIGRGVDLVELGAMRGSAALPARGLLLACHCVPPSPTTTIYYGESRGHQKCFLESRSFTHRFLNCIVVDACRASIGMHG